MCIKFSKLGTQKNIFAKIHIRTKKQQYFFSYKVLNWWTNDGIVSLNCFCSNEEIYICHDGNTRNAIDRVMQKCGELVKLKPQKVMETIAQYRYVCIGSTKDTHMYDTLKGSLKQVLGRFGILLVSFS